MMFLMKNLYEALKTTGSNPFDWSPVPNDYFQDSGGSRINAIFKRQADLYGSVLGEMPTVKLTYEKNAAPNRGRRRKACIFERPLWEFL